jgi:hypothetical protein
MFSLEQLLLSPLQHAPGLVSYAALFKQKFLNPSRLNRVTVFIEIGTHYVRVMQERPFHTSQQLVKEMHELNVMHKRKVKISDRDEILYPMMDDVDNKGQPLQPSIMDDKVAKDFVTDDISTRDGTVHMDVKDQADFHPIFRIGPICFKNIKQEQEIDQDGYWGWRRDDSSWKIGNAVIAGDEDDKRPITSIFNPSLYEGEILTTGKVVDQASDMGIFGELIHYFGTYDIIDPDLSACDIVWTSFVPFEMPKMHEFFQAGVTACFEGESKRVQYVHPAIAILMSQGCSTGIVMHVGCMSQNAYICEVRSGMVRRLSLFQDYLPKKKKSNVWILPDPKEVLKDDDLNENVLSDENKGDLVRWLQTCLTTMDANTLVLSGLYCHIMGQLIKPLLKERMTIVECQTADDMVHGMSAWYRLGK